MFIAGNFVIAAASILDMILSAYIWVVIIAALITWVNPDPYNPVVRFLRAVTEPVFRPVRRLIGYRLGPVDVSPVVIILAIYFIQKFFVRSLVDLGIKLKGGIVL